MAENENVSLYLLCAIIRHSTFQVATLKRFQDKRKRLKVGALGTVGHIIMTLVYVCLGVFLCLFCFVYFCLFWGLLLLLLCWGGGLLGLFVGWLVVVFVLFFFKGRGGGGGGAGGWGSSHRYSNASFATKLLKSQGLFLKEAEKSDCYKKQESV